ncbi:MAG TPA: imidazolonepropionase [Phycisphaerales bacterium]|nr:imidazolonepropionase [Phycisphaerales bacterium]
MARILFTHARVLTLAKGPRPRRGKDLGELGVIASADVLVENGVVSHVFAPGAGPTDPGVHVVEAAGRVLMPAFIDCHTHACWTGSRIDEWEQKLAGATYLDILAKGGGIMSTVRAVRGVSQMQLRDQTLAHLHDFILQGTTTVEVKSGYGLSTEHELKMLRATREAAKVWAGTVVQTALLGHAVEPDDPRFVERVISETLPAVVREFPHIPVDVFCEASSWSVDDAAALLKAAMAAGCPVRAHADQFNSLGFVRQCIELGARSVDHLEASTPEDLRALAASRTIGVGLPVCGMHLDGRYPNLKAVVEAGGAVAIATNSNPGSAPTSSMPMAIAAAVRHCGLSAAQAIAAATVNAAAVLGLPDRGVIAHGARADLILLRHKDERALAYELGGNPVDLVVCGGRVFTTKPTPSDM